MKSSKSQGESQQPRSGPVAKTTATVRARVAKDGPLMFSFQEDAVHEARDQLQLQGDQLKALAMAERMRVDFVYNGAALEGNPMTFPEVKTLIEGVTVGGHKLSDAEQVLNLNRALSHVLGLVRAGTFAVDAMTAKAIQGIVAKDEALTWGDFRDGPVFIGGTDYRPPQAKDLSAIFESGAVHLHQIQDPILRAFLIFLWGSLMQFFHDGNKRTARLLASGTLLTAGYPPLMIEAKDQLRYNQIMMNFYNTQDATVALGWLYEYYRARVTGFGFDKPATHS